MRTIALAGGGALGLATAAVALWLRAAGEADARGFLGPGSLLGDLNLTLEILLVLGLTAGMFLARRGSIEAHRVNQSIWALVNAGLVVGVMAPSLANAKVSSFADLARWSAALPWLHAMLGALTVIGALWLVLQMNDVLPKAWHIAGWKPLMRMTLAGYWAVALLGIMLYFQWYAG